MTQQVIAFLGTGLMGQPMACRLLQASYPVRVWNRSIAKTARCAELGADVATTPEAAVAGADIVITMLADGAAVQAVLSAALPCLQAGALVIDMSSTRQSEAVELETMLAARRCEFMDAPVSGGVAGAESGTLAIMAGASPENFARAQALLAVLGRPTLVGAPGTGQLAKLCNQLIVGGTINLVAEALLLAQAGGADPAAVRLALRGGFADSKILELHGQRMLERNFMPGGQVKTQCKDMENILTAALVAGLHLPLTDQVAAIFQRLQLTDPQADHSAALLDLERHNVGYRLGDSRDIKPHATNNFYRD